MIQRIQTVYLALVALVFILLFVLPIAVFPLETGSLSFDLLSVKKMSSEGVSEVVQRNYLLMVPAVLIIVFSAYTITLYKKRQLQMRLTSLLILLVAVFMVIEYFVQESVMKQFSVAKAIYGVGTYLPIVSFLLLVLAQRSIKKDEELVRSADRLR